MRLVCQQAGKEVVLKVKRNKNYKMLVGRAVTGSDLGIVHFQSMKNLVFGFILI